MNISLVIPAYNEQDNVRQLVEACIVALRPFEGSHEILVIDDGSTDNTGPLLAELATREPRLRTIHHDPGKNIGCHPSELEGLKSAHGDVALFLPADLQVHPSSLRHFLQAVQSADIVASHRVNRSDPLWRRLLARANNRVERLILGLPVHDAHSAMLVNRRTLEDVIPHVLSRSALIPAELMFRARRRGLRIAEIEVEHFPRTAGRQTGAKFSEILKVQLDMLRLRRRLTRKAHEAA